MTITDTTDRVADHDIIERVLAGDTASFALIMRRYNRRLYRIARSVLPSAADAEDAVQNAYLQAYSHLAQFTGKGPFSGWLARIALNEALGRRRGMEAVGSQVSFDDPQEREEANYMTSLITSLPSPELTAARSEVRQLLETAIDALPVAYRTAFIMCGVEEMSIAETADCLDLEPGTVKTRYHRARLMLREQLSSLVDAMSEEVFSFDGARCDRIVAGVLARLQQRPPAEDMPGGTR
jgi:RNA polymerase sigma-70 factor (ECF subfamily)